MGGKSKYRNTMMPIDTAQEVRSKDYYKAFDVGLSIALGFNYRLNNKTWIKVDLVYNNGLTNQDKTGIGSRSIFLNVRLVFKLGYTNSNAAQ